jgi:hypothetical protein
LSALLIVPLVLSALMLGAHFFRAAEIGLTAVCLAAPFLLAARRVWAVRVVQVLAVVGAAIWARTAVVLAGQRVAAGRPWLRMAIILGSVAAFTLLSALLVEVWRRRKGIGAPGGRS